MSVLKTVITMVGPSNVGKTSLLAAMYKELEDELKNSGCSIFQEAGSSQREINDKLKNLKKLANGAGLKIQPGEGIDGSQQERRYAFHIDVGCEGQPSVTLEFVDLPGGWYTGKGEYKRADQVLGESHVSFLAVDATALMEGQGSNTGGIGKYHDDINAPNDIRESYKRVSFKEDHFVILVLIRAESYVEGGIDDLLVKTQKAYRDLANDLNSKGIPLLACYVETVGSLTFHSFVETDDEKPEIHFLRNPSIGYKPNRCAIPLRIAARIALAGALDKSLEKVIQEDTLLSRVLDLFGFETRLKEEKKKYARVYQAIELITQKIKEDDFVEIKP
jgi:Double-GTPase 2